MYACTCNKAQGVAVCSVLLPYDQTTDGYQRSAFTELGLVICPYYHWECFPTQASAPL